MRTARTLGCLCCLLAFNLASGGDAPAEDRYAKDLEFLLRELPQRAAPLLAVKGIDWRTVSNEFRASATTITNDVQHLRLCQRVLAKLRDGHARLTDLKVPMMPDESRGRRWTGPRVHLMVVGESVFIRQAFGTAAERGLKAGQEVLRIDDQPARQWLAERVSKMSDEAGYSTAAQALYAACHWGLADWEGTRLKLQVVQAGRTNTVECVRNGGSNYVPIGPVFPPTSLKSLGRQSYGRTARGFGYIHLRDVPANLPDQLDTMLAAVGDAPGLILDLRANGGGGCDHSAMFGEFVPAGQQWRKYPSHGSHPFAGPIVLIVDPGTRSAGETVAGMLKEDGRVYVIGEAPTAGMSSSKTTLPLPSGLASVYFSVSSNLGRANGGRGIEGVGIPPQEIVAYDPVELLQGVDTQIRRAEDLLKAGLPQDQVPFLRVQSK